MKTLLFVTVIAFSFASCSKSTTSAPGSSGGYNNATGLLPLAVNNHWNYRLKYYDTLTGSVIDSSNFTLTVTGQMAANGITYFSLVNSLDNSTLWVTNLNASSLGSIDSVGGISYYTLFAAGNGDSLQSVSSWPISVPTNGGTCQGSEKLYAYYADTTLANLDGTVYSNSIKSDAVKYDCSGQKFEAQVYFVKQGIGLVRYAQYVYNAKGDHLLELAWILESYNL